jgi:gliding motility-associated-like protein
MNQFFATTLASVLLRSFLAIGLFLVSVFATAQTCGGSLGENIFTAGDFGSGTANVVANDPGIAPGFIYQPFPPPLDGFYTITSNTGAWANRFGTWQAFSDNSDDPNGYMMIVNAAFAPGLFYEQQVDDLCENLLYQFTADVRNVIAPGINELLPNISFLLDGVEAFTTGPVGETGRWQNYGFTFTARPGQTSITLALRNNAPGGQGNDLALDNIEFRACGPEALIAGIETIRVCENGNGVVLAAEIIGTQYDTPAQQWQRSLDGGNNWIDIPGANELTYTHMPDGNEIYFYRYALASGTANLANLKCRVLSNVKVLEVVPLLTEITDTICAGLSYTVGNQAYTTTGIFVDTLASSLGCDSIVTLELTVLDDPGLVTNFATTDPSCSYLADGSIQLLDVSNGSAPYRYQFDGMPRNLATTATDLAEGEYDYEVTDRFGCRAEGTLTLRSPNVFIFELGPDQSLSLGQGVRLRTGATDLITNYDFSPPGVIDCTADCEGELLLPTETLTLVLTASSPQGCVFTDSITFVVMTDRLVYPPTAFSPNGDGVNDKFILFGATPNVTRIARLEVYNRWGGRVFSGVDLPLNETSLGWDGRVNGQAAETGTYFYVAQVVFLDGRSLPYQGDFVLVR